MTLIERFDGLADSYDRLRPRYPDALVARLVARAPAGPLVDLAAGTGFLTEAFLAARPGPVIAVEPGSDMRRVLTERFGAEPRVEIRDGTAEATGLGGATAALVAAGTAFHWFDAERALAEAARILRPGGVVAILYNAWLPGPGVSEMAEHVKVIAAEPMPHDGSAWHRGPILLRRADFAGYAAETERWSKTVSAEDAVDTAMTWSRAKTAAAKHGADRLRAELRGLLPGDRVELRYETLVAWAVRQ